MCPQAEDLGARFVVVVVAPAYTGEDCDAVVEAVGKVAGAVL
jgi:hypothetical protein